MNDGSNWSYMLQDGLGSVRAEITQNVSVNGSQSYAPYGEVFGASGAMSSPFAFTGEPLDGNGLQYHRARYYMPSSGVWANQDFAETQNRYSYAQSNPSNWADPTGLCVFAGADTLICLEALTGYYAGGVLSTEANQDYQDIDFGQGLNRQFRDLENWYNPYSEQSIFTYYQLSRLGLSEFFLPIRAFQGVGAAINRTTYDIGQALFPQAEPAQGTVIGGVEFTPEELVLLCNAGWCNSAIDLSQLNVSKEEFDTALDRGYALINIMVQSRTRPTDEVKYLWRGSSLTGARRAVKAFSGFIGFDELVARTDMNKFWLASTLYAVLPYAGFNALSRGESGVILLFAVVKSQLRSLIEAGHVTDRAGNPVDADVGLEYGFDVVAVPSLIGPAILPSPPRDYDFN